MLAMTIIWTVRRYVRTRRAVEHTVIECGRDEYLVRVKF